VDSQTDSKDGAYPNRPLRIAFVGDSITWVDGILGDGFVGRADEYIRNRFAETVTHDRMVRFGRFETVRSRKLFGGSATKLLGTGSGASFDITGDELTVVQAKERTNESAAWIDLYVDGVRYDSFSNWNEQPCGTESLRFAGDGATAAYDLGRAFTYAHRVVVDGQPLTGSILTTGYGSGFPAGQDYAVIRKYSAVRQETAPAVHHFLWFAVPPPTGAVIEATFRYGETIVYAKGSVGETEQAIDSPLESRYGDGGTDGSGTCVGPISFGLDLRESDSRAALTWRFPHAAKRTFELRIRGFDPRGNASGEPYAIVNFATNRHHAIMNAGIGGKSARWFNGSDPLRSIRPVLEWKPDIVFIGLGTNDDWEPGNGFAAWRTIELAEAEALNRPVLCWKSCTPTGTGYCRIETAELKAAAAAERSVVIDGTNATFDNVKAGDIVVIGDYNGDNRNVQSRILTDWDEASRTCTFDEPLQPNVITGRIADYAGQTVRIKRTDGFAKQLILLIQTIREAVPARRIALLETGLSHFDTRLLMGYPEQIRLIAEKCGAVHVPIYAPLMKWQFAQSPDIPVRPVADRSAAADGTGVYLLTAPDGHDVHERLGMQLRHWSVRVNGVERYGNGCRIEGGFAVAFAAGVSSPALTDWEGRRSSLATYRYLPAKLVFVADIPPPDATIEVKVASAKWSADDTHLNLPGGIGIYAKQVEAALERIVAGMER